jgi:hypothetical protein
MKLFFKSKDGGKESNVTGYWLIEWKSVFSIVLLCFDKGSREAYHNHAFDSWSWILCGKLLEHVKEGNNYYTQWIIPSIIPLWMPRERMHKVEGIANKTWALSFRGTWTTTWKEYFYNENKEVILINGRQIINEAHK